MRFNQLKSNPNSIVKKRLKKSGTQWVIVSSLFFAGAIFIGGTTTVYADDTPTVSTTSTETNDQSETNSGTTVTDGSSGTVGTEDTKLDSTKGQTSNSTDKDSGSTGSGTANDGSGISGSSNNTISGDTENTPASSTANKNTDSINNNDGTNTTSGSTDTTNNSDGINTTSGSTDTTNNNDGTNTTSGNTDPANGNDGTNTTPGNTDLVDDVTSASDEATNEESAAVPMAASAEVAAPNIAEGTFGTSNWYVSSDNVLHIGAGDLATSIYTSPWASYSDQITSIVFDDVVNGNADSSYLFSGLTKVTSIVNANNFNASNVLYMDYIFSTLPSLTELDISKWDTQNVVSMNHMFFGDMFSGGGHLKSLDLSNWNVSNVKDMSGMFSGQSDISSIDLSKWNVSNVTNMSGMFQSDSNLKSLNVSNWDVSKVKTFSSMFIGDKSLDSLDLSTWKMSSTANSNYLFANADIKQLVLSGNDIFSGDPALSNLPTSDTLTGKWINVGTGTVDNPEGSSKLTSEELMALYANNGGPDDTWVREGVQKIDTSVTASVIIESNLGSQTVENQTGNIGDTITVKVPQIDGYTSDKETVSAIVNANKTITTDEQVKYTADPSTGGSGSTDTGNNGNTNNNNNNTGDTDNNGSTGTNPGGSETNDSQIIAQDQTVATYADEPAAQLYDVSGNIIEGRFLDTNTDWQSDQVLISNGTMYYRVSTDEWVRADDVYVYVSDNGTAKAYLDSDKALIDAHYNESSRTLAAGTDWLFDRYTEINGNKYYRVSTNEFVKEDSVLPYTAVNDVVNTSSNNVVVYNETGTASKHTLSANTAWKTDKVAKINGIQMYRVSTNEWVKASDVVLNDNI
ncbi:BspA family leucine-rich repeat surface protein [Companilactobacillus keshanensis]|uniref:BspA family leucine-rich repeat surface protein n=1 Tax=Companilactobacillus keshanensis TaxID=2486003 RepID=A0ABW4BW82_9LACO|nr:BspA family leucine-rich repeat surface protein [Companilactobacillus keshanensis]